MVVTCNKLDQELKAPTTVCVENYFAHTEHHPIEPLKRTKDIISKRISRILSLSISNPMTYDCSPLLTNHAPSGYVP